MRLRITWIILGAVGIGLMIGIIVPLVPVGRVMGLAQEQPAKLPKQEVSHKPAQGSCCGSDIDWSKEVGITNAQKQRLNQIDKQYLEQAKNYSALWRAKMQEREQMVLSGTPDKRLLMQLVQAEGDAYTKCQLAQVLRAVAVWEVLTPQQRQKMKTLQASYASHKMWLWQQA